MRRWSLLLLALLLPVLAHAQLKPYELSWKLGEKALRTGNDDGVIDAWQPLLTMTDWPFSRSREDVTLTVAAALRRASRPSEAYPLVQQILTKTPTGLLAERAHTLRLCLALDQEKEADVTSQVQALAVDAKGCSDEALERILLGVVTEMNAPEVVERIIEHFLTAEPGSPRAARLTLTYAKLMDTSGNPRGACDRMETLWQTAPDLRLLVGPTLVVQAQKVGRLGLATNVAQSLAAMYPADAGLRQTAARAVELQTRWEQLQTRVNAELAIRLDRPVATSQEDDAYLRGLFMDVVGGVYLVDAALAVYLAERPVHSRYASLLALRLRMLADAGDWQAVATIAPAIYQEVVGQPEEATVGLLWGQALAKGGEYRAAALLCTRLASFFPRESRFTSQGFAAARQTGDAALIGQLVQRYTKPSQASDGLLQALYWLCSRALTAHDLPAAQRWVAQLNTLAPEHQLAFKARKLLRAAQKGAK